MAFHQTRILAIKWKDKNDEMLWNVHTNKIVDVMYHNKLVNKPTVILDYNKSMGREDIVN